MDNNLSIDNYSKAELGYGNGTIISFITWSGNKPRIEVKIKGISIARHDFMFDEFGMFLKNPKTGKKSYLPTKEDEWVDFRVKFKDSLVTIYYDGDEVINTTAPIPFYKNPKWVLAARTGGLSSRQSFKDISIKTLEQKSTNFIVSHNPIETILEFRSFYLFDFEKDTLKIKVDGEDAILKDKNIEDETFIFKIGYKDNKVLESNIKHTIIMEWKERIGLRRIEKEFNIKPYTSINSDSS